MWKLFFIVFFLLAQIKEGFCVTQWLKGAPAASNLKSAWPAASQANNSILDSLLSNYQRGFVLTYTDSATLTASSGEVVVSNSLGTVRLFLVKTTSTAITSSNLDTGAIAANTTYYVYAGTSTATDAAPTFYVSLSSSAPTGITYYEQLGTFSTDANSQFTGVINNNLFHEAQGPAISKSQGVLYHALTDLEVGCWANNTSSTFNIQTSSISGSIAIVQACGQNSNSYNLYCSIGWIIRKGDYYEFAGSSANCYAEPLGK